MFSVGIRSSNNVHSLIWLWLAILEAVIPGLYFIHLPNTKYSLSAFEYQLIGSASKEFLPPATRIFKQMNGCPVGVYVPQCMVINDDSQWW